MIRYQKPSVHRADLHRVFGKSRTADAIADSVNNPIQTGEGPPQNAVTANSTGVYIDLDTKQIYVNKVTGTNNNWF